MDHMENIIYCDYNMDNGYVEVAYINGNILKIKCEDIEANLRTTEHSRAALGKLLDNNPVEYIAMALSGEMQEYCNIEDEMIKDMSGSIIQGYLKQGYSLAMAEALMREFFRYDS